MTDSDFQGMSRGATVTNPTFDAPLDLAWAGRLTSDAAVEASPVAWLRAAFWIRLMSDGDVKAGAAKGD